MTTVAAAFIGMKRGLAGENPAYRFVLLLRH